MPINTRNVSEGDVIPFAPRDAKPSASGPDTKTGDVVKLPNKAKQPSAEPAADDNTYRVDWKAEHPNWEDPNPDPNHWWDMQKFDKKLWPAARKTNNPHWWELQAKALWHTLTNNPGHPDTVKMVWSGLVPYEIVQLISSCMKRIPNGTRDGRASPKYKPLKAKSAKDPSVTG